MFAFCSQLQSPLHYLRLAHGRRSHAGIILPALHRMGIDNSATFSYNVIKAELVEALGQLEPQLPI